MASRQGLPEGLPGDQKVARTHELGVGLADDVVGALAAHNLAVGVAAFGGREG